MKELATEILKFISLIFTHFQKSGRVVKKISTLFDIMYSLINNNSQINQILVLAAHNSGKRLSVLSHNYISCLHEVHTPDFAPVKAEFQRVPMDRSYAVSLSKLVDDKQLYFETDKLEAGSLMKTMFEAQHIECGKMFLLKETSKFLYFMVVNSSNPQITLAEPETDLALRIAHSKIKELIN